MYLGISKKWVVVHDVGWGWDNNPRTKGSHFNFFKTMDAHYFLRTFYVPEIWTNDTFPKGSGVFCYATMHIVIVIQVRHRITKSFIDYCAWLNCTPGTDVSGMENRISG